MGILMRHPGIDTYPESGYPEMTEEQAVMYEARGWERVPEVEDDPDDFASLKVPELHALVAERGLEPESNKKADLIAALEADRELRNVTPTDAPPVADESATE